MRVVIWFPAQKCLILRLIPTFGCEPLLGILLHGLLWGSHRRICIRQDVVSAESRTLDVTLVCVHQGTRVLTRRMPNRFGDTLNVNPISSLIERCQQAISSAVGFGGLHRLIFKSKISHRHTTSWRGPWRSIFLVSIFVTQLCLFVQLFGLLRNNFSLLFDAETLQHLIGNTKLFVDELGLESGRVHVISCFVVIPVNLMRLILHG